MMINKAIAYEEVLKELSKQSLWVNYRKKVNSRSPIQQGLMPRRKTLSFITPNKSLCQSINNSRLVQGNTEALKRPYQTIQK